MRKEKRCNMNNPIINSGLLQSISPNKVEAYLEAEGWSKSGELPTKFSVWRLNEEEVIVPKSPELSDYAKRIAETLSTIAKLLGTSPDDIFKRIVSSTSDLIKIRVNSSNKIKHSIPFEHGLELLDSIKRMFQASARATLSKKIMLCGKKKGKGGKKK